MIISLKFLVVTRALILVLDSEIISLHKIPPESISEHVIFQGHAPDPLTLQF